MMSAEPSANGVLEACGPLIPAADAWAAAAAEVAAAALAAVVGCPEPMMPVSATRMSCQMSATDCAVSTSPPAAAAAAPEVALRPGKPVLLPVLTLLDRRCCTTLLIVPTRDSAT